MPAEPAVVLQVGQMMTVEGAVMDTGEKAPDLLGPDDVLLEYALTVRTAAGPVRNLRGSFRIPELLYDSNLPVAPVQFANVLEMVLLRPAEIAISGLLADKVKANTKAAQEERNQTTLITDGRSEIIPPSRTDSGASPAAIAGHASGVPPVE